MTRRIIRIFFRILLGVGLTSSFLSPTFATAGVEETLPGSDPVFHDESELGLLFTRGNANSESINVSQINTYSWDANLLKLNAKYLYVKSNQLMTARYWILGLRYERELKTKLGVFLGESVESDVFSGYQIRYNTDASVKFFLFHEGDSFWSTETGYRYTIEKRFGNQINQNYIRFFSEYKRAWNQSLTFKTSLEYLPNFTIISDYQLNGEISLTTALNKIFAMKIGYTVKYRNIPPPPATRRTDTQFTTSLVAKF